MAGLKMTTSAVNVPFLAGAGEEEDAVVVPYTL